MAIVQLPIPFAARNLAGNMIFQHYHGKTHMRAYPDFVTNPQTPDQILNRNYFQELISIFKKLKGNFSSFFYYKPRTMTTYNSVISALLKSYDIINNQKVLSASKIKFGSGKITDTFAHSFNVVNIYPQPVIFSFELYPNLPEQLLAGNFRIVLVNFTTNNAQLLSDGQPLSSQNFSISSSFFEQINSDCAVFFQIINTVGNYPLTPFVTAPELFFNYN